MTNLIKALEVKFPEIKDFNVSVAYVEFDELYMTSEYAIPTDLYDKCENYAVNEGK